MEWTKIKTKHFLYNDMTDAQLGCLVTLLCLTAFLERMPTRKEMLQHMHHASLKSLEKKLMETSRDGHEALMEGSRTLHDVLHKVLEDVVWVENRRRVSRDSSKRYRERHSKSDTSRQRHVTNQIREEKIREYNIPPKPPKRGDGWIKDFHEIFWPKYPKKVSKQQALKSWVKIEPSPGLAEKITAALEKQKKSRQWTQADGQYIPHPANWLNNRRWEDEESHEESFRDMLNRVTQ